MHAADWRQLCAWARRRNLPAQPPDPQILGLYIAACASGAAGPKACSVKTIERRLSALMWNFAQRGEKFDRAHGVIGKHHARLRLIEDAGMEKRTSISR